MFRGVSVLLDERPSQGGTMAHASEWAERLHLPLRPRSPAPRRRRASSSGPLNSASSAARLPPAFRQTLLARSLRTPDAAVLTCPPAWRPLSRVLVLNQGRRPGDGFLDTVVALCRTFQVVPVVLTVGRTESAARVL